ncbi:zinc-binding dehydrogenase [Celeribacter baekdonensis]|uniref:zinc-binding dehydrogenase n=1 Tax=Celeribacter baekdonensis TaxID=875171 RepID=UPI0030D7A5B4
MQHQEHRDGARAGADVVIDYTRQDFARELSDWDLGLNALDGDTLMTSVGVLSPGGRLISISGPPELAFARPRGLNVVLKAVFAAISFKIRRAAKKAGVTYAFLYRHASGEPLEKLTTLVEQGIMTPVIDRIFPFSDTPGRGPSGTRARKGQGRHCNGIAIMSGGHGRSEPRYLSRSEHFDKSRSSGHTRLLPDATACNCPVRLDPREADRHRINRKTIKRLTRQAKAPPLRIQSPAKRA